MPAREVLFKCLHCGYEYTGLYDPKNMAERTCPKCRSNSIRRLPNPKPATKR